MNTTKDLLTENNYWTFWSNGWSKNYSVYWGGQIPFDSVKEALRGYLGEGFTYERQVEIKNPDLKFA